MGASFDIIKNMSEHFTSEEEYRAYLEWKTSQESKTIKAGDAVRVPRSDGSIDNEGWVVRYTYPDDNTGELTASVVNELQKIKKEIPLSVLNKYNG